MLVSLSKERASTYSVEVEWDSFAASLGSAICERLVRCFLASFKHFRRNSRSITVGGSTNAMKRVSKI